MTAKPSRTLQHDSLPKIVQPYALKMTQRIADEAFFDLSTSFSRNELDAAFRDFSISCHPDRHNRIDEQLKEEIASVFSYGQRIYASLKTNSTPLCESKISRTVRPATVEAKTTKRDSGNTRIKRTPKIAHISRGAGKKMIRRQIKQKLSQTPPSAEPDPNANE